MGRDGIFRGVVPGHWMIAILLAAFMASPRAFAHASSTAYLEINDLDRDTPGTGQSTYRGTWKVDLLDLNVAVPLDLNRDFKITWGEVQASRDQIANALRGAFHFSTPGSSRCEPALNRVSTRAVNGNAFAVLDWQASCAASNDAVARVNYDFLFERNSMHAAILSTGPDRAPVVLTAKSRGAVIPPAITRAEGPPGTSLATVFQTFIKEGIWHIFIGHDHILFLLTMLLAAVRTSWRDSAVEALKVITAFTAAHSVTLFLVATGVISLPARFVETAIAASIIIAALNNIFSFMPGRTWIIAASFGLIHGFGFASVLGGIDIDRANLVATVLAFNIGVEAGQIAIVAVALPVLVAAGHRKFFQPVILTGGSVLASLAGLFWMIDRM